jgi:alpha-methylacyl-CoA racemase
MTGWGQDGPLAPTAGHDITYLAITGLLHGIGPAEGPPVVPVNYVADFGGGAMFLATGLLAALLHARAAGEGQVVDAAMTDGASYLGSMTRTFVSRGTWKDEREANMIDGGSPNYRCYEAADGKWVAVGALEPQFWSTLVQTLGFDEASTPTPYAPDDWDACRKLLADTFRTKARDEWAEIFASLDACVAPVLTLDEALRHPHNVARGTFVDVDGAPMPGPAPRFSRTQGSVGAVPEIGSATTELLTEAGYDDAGLAELRAAGAIE